MPDPIIKNILPYGIQGFQSAQAPITLPGNIMAMIQNGRLGNGLVEARSGDALIRTNVVAGQVCRGVFSCLLNGTPMLFAAYGDGNNVLVGQSLDGGTTWSTITTGTTILSDRHAFTVTGASNASPILVTVSAAHNFVTGDYVTVAGVGGNTAANGTFTVTVVSTTTFYLNGSTGNSAYTAGGTARLTYPRIVHFQVVRDLPVPGLSPYDLLVIQNGFDEPRIFGNATAASSKFTSGTPGIAVAYQPPQPPLDANLAFSPGFTQFWDIKVAGTTFASTNALKIKIQDSNSGFPFNYWKGTVFAVDDTIETATITPTTSINLTESNQLTLMVDNFGLVDIVGAVGSPIVIESAVPHLLATGDKTRVFSVTGNTAANGNWPSVTYVDATHFSLDGSASNGAYVAGGQFTETTVTDFWGQMAVILTDNLGVTAAAYDPSAGTTSPIEVNRDTGALTGFYNLQQIAYNIPANSTAFNFANIKKISFEWFGPQPPIDTFFSIFMAVGGGASPGGAALAVDYVANDSRSIGPTRIYPDIQESPVSLWGGTDFSDYSTNTYTPTVIDDPRFFFDYLVTTSNTDATALAAGVDYAYLYANFPGQTAFYYVQKLKIATWGGLTWGYVTGTAGSAVQFARPFGDQDFNHEAPGGDALITPVGTAMATGNGRTLVCGGSTLWVSDYGAPWTYRAATLFTNGVEIDGSGTSMDRPGETFQQIITLGSFAGASEENSTPIIGSTTFHILTDQHLYALSGFSSASLSHLISIAPHGTLAPLSPARTERGFYWIDQRGEICSYGSIVPFNSPNPYNMAGFKQLSVSQVDDILAGIPGDRQKWVTGAAMRNRYYMSLTPRGQTANTQAMVFYERMGVFESIDTQAVPMQFLLSHYASGFVQLLAFSDTDLYQHEVPLNTTGVSFSMTFKEYGADLHSLPDFENRLQCKAFGIVSDCVPAGTVTWTIAKYVPETQVTTTGTIPFTAGAGVYRMWEWESLSQPQPSYKSYTIQPTVSATVPGGTKIYAVFWKTAPAPSGGNR